MFNSIKKELEAQAKSSHTKKNNGVKIENFSSSNSMSPTPVNTTPGQKASVIIDLENDATANHPDSQQRIANPLMMPNNGAAQYPGMPYSSSSTMI